MTEFALQEMSEKQRECLKRYLRYEQWTVEQALCLLCGINPDTVEIAFSGRLPTFKLISHIPFSSDRRVAALAEHLKVKMKNEIEADSQLRELYELESVAAELHQIWNSAGRVRKRFPPLYFIEWAKKVKHKVEWLEWAEETGNLPSKVRTVPPKTVSIATVESDEFKGKRRGSAFRLIAALLKNFCHLDVEHPEHGAVLNLYRSLYSANTEMDEDTLRSLIKEAAVVVKMDRKRHVKNEKNMSSEQHVAKISRASLKSEILFKNRNT